MAQTALQKILATLRKRYGKPQPHPAGRDPLALILWEMVAYLADDETRFRAFDALRVQVGLAPMALLRAPLPVLTAICRIGGGVQPQQRAQRIQTIAALALNDFDGNVSQLLAWEYTKARKALQRFPSVGEPGADRILMLCGSHPILGLDSNALRSLYRIGYGRETKNYTRTYRESRDAAMAELPKTASALADASVTLRAHGQATCKYGVPRCEECVITASCAWFKAHAG
jgi:endonuclease III